MNTQIQSSGHIVGGETIGNVAKGTREDANAALDAARAAFNDAKWRRMDPSERGRIRYRFSRGPRTDGQEKRLAGRRRTLMVS